jgi:hypothetical protein
MKTVKLLTQCSAAFLAVLSARAQDAFQNLNFEQANPIYAGAPNPLYVVTAASALPYWMVTTGGVQQTQVFYNATSTGATEVSLIGSGAEPYLSPLDGNYSVLLTGGGTTPGASISQTGLIPNGTQSLLFEAQLETLGSPGPLDVSIGGENVPFFAVETEPNYTLYEANISAWARETEQLTFSAPAVNTGLNAWEIDDISFSTTAVTPEPSVVALTAIGGVLFGARRVVCVALMIS